MMGRTHALLGIDALWLLEPWGLAESSDRLFPLAVIGSVVGALLPDVDAPVSLLSQISFGGVRPLSLPARWLNRRYGHRGALHSLRGWGIAALLSCPLLLIGFQAGNGLALWLGLVLGYGSHLLGDGLTRSGIPLLYPNPRRVHLLPKPLRLLTGSLAEDGVLVVSGAVALALLLRHLPFEELILIAPHAILHLTSIPLTLKPMLWNRPQTPCPDPAHHNPSRPAPFVLEHRFEDVRSGGYFTPTAAVWLTPALRESGLLRDLAPDDLRLLLGVLSGVGGNGTFVVTPELLTQSLGLSARATRAGLERLESLTWNGEPLLGSQISESGLHFFHPSPHLLQEHRSVISSPPADRGHVEVPDVACSRDAPVVPGNVREAVVAHSRASYTRPRAEVEAEINHFLSPDWQKPLEETAQEQSGDEPKPAVTPAAREWLRLKRALVGLGVPLHRAQALLEAHPPEKIAEQLEWLSYRHARNPVAYVIAAIEKNYAPPPVVSLQRVIAEEKGEETEPIAHNLDIKDDQQEKSLRKNSDTTNSDPVEIGVLGIEAISDRKEADEAR